MTDIMTGIAARCAAAEQAKARTDLALAADHLRRCNEHAAREGRRRRMTPAEAIAQICEEEHAHMSAARAGRAFDLMLEFLRRSPATASMGWYGLMMLVAGHAETDIGELWLERGREHERQREERAQSRKLQQEWQERAEQRAQRERQAWYDYCQRPRDWQSDAEEVAS